MREFRSTKEAVALEERAGGEVVISGYAAVFNEPSGEMWGGLTERIQPGAFAKSLEEISETRPVMAFWNHNSDLVMGSTRSSLTLREDERGLAFELAGPFEGFERELGALRRGDVRGTSFGFEMIRDHHETDPVDPDKVNRTLIEVRLHEISPTPFPAYPTTDVQVRKAHRAAVELGRPDVFWRAVGSAGLQASELRSMGLSPIGQIPLEQPTGTDIAIAHSYLVDVIAR